MNDAKANKSLVLIVGAGASNEANLPVGTELKSHIASALDIRYDFDRQISGDKALANALHVIASRNRVYLSLSPLLKACWIIRDAMPQAASIDNFIDAHRNNPKIESCGKLAIALCILNAESRSLLHVDSGNVFNKINFKSVKDTWFNKFFQLLVDGCQRTEIPRRLSQVAIISFNYDRCIEHFLHSSLCNYYDLEITEATEIMSHLEIYHPYGSIGQLPWQALNGIGFGAEINSHSLCEVAKKLKTFTEGTDENHSDIITIRRIVHQADQTVYLGFAFNPQNLQLLYGSLNDKGPQQRPVFGTAFGMSKSDIQIIANQLSELGRYPLDKIFLERELKCSDLLQEYGRSLAIH